MSVSWWAMVLILRTVYAVPRHVLRIMHYNYHILPSRKKALIVQKQNDVANFMHREMFKLFVSYYWWQRYLKQLRSVTFMI